MVISIRSQTRFSSCLGRSQDQENSPLIQLDAIISRKLGTFQQSLSDRIDQHILGACHHHIYWANMFVSSIRKGNPFVVISMSKSPLLVCNDPIHGSNKLRYIRSFGQILRHLVSEITSQDCQNIDNLTTIFQFLLVLCNLSSLKEVSCQFHCINASKAFRLVRNYILHHSFTVSILILSIL